MPSFRTKVPDFAGKRQAANVVQTIKNFLNDSRFHQFLNTGTTIFNATESLIENPHPLNAARAVFDVLQYIVSEQEVYGSFFEDSDDWVEPYSRHFSGTILKMLAKHPFTVMNTTEETVQLRIIDVDGIKIGCAYDAKLHAFDRQLYAEIAHLDAAKQMVKDLLWSEYKDKAIVLRKVQTKKEDESLEFEIEDMLHPLPSKKASEVSKYLQRCFDADVNRSIMLCGPPGTGKSTMARMIVDNLGMRSLRFAVEDMSSYGNKVIFEAINIFQPDAIILDDFDRSSSQSSLLETLEFFQRHVKLVIATVNNKDELDDAILRPGRFDELIWVEHIDEAVVRHVLGDYLEDFDVVKTWPIAFIVEYVKRRRFMDPEEAHTSMNELASRVASLSASSGGEFHDWDALTSFKKSKSKSKRPRKVRLKKAHDDDDQVDQSSD